MITASPPRCVPVCQTILKIPLHDPLFEIWGEWGRHNGDEVAQLIALVWLGWWGHMTCWKKLECSQNYANGSKSSLAVPSWRTFSFALYTVWLSRMGSSLQIIGTERSSSSDQCSAFDKAHFIRRLSMWPQSISRKGLERRMALSLNSFESWRPNLSIREIPSGDLTAPYHVRCISSLGTRHLGWDTLSSESDWQYPSPSDLTLYLHLPWLDSDDIIAFQAPISRKDRPFLSVFRRLANSLVAPRCTPITQSYCLVSISYRERPYANTFGWLGSPVPTIPSYVIEPWNTVVRRCNR